MIDPVADDPRQARRVGGVDVVEQSLQGLDPLLHAAVDDVPLRRRDDAGHDVEGERPLLTGVVERDALVEVAAGQGVGALLELVGGHGADGLVHAGVGRPRRAGPGQHLVPGPRGRHLVGVEERHVRHRSHPP